MSLFDEIQKSISNILNPLGFEIYPFQTINGVGSGKEGHISIKRQIPTERSFLLPSIIEGLLQEGSHSSLLILNKSGGFLKQIGWYNEKVSEPFRFSYPAETLAFIIISTPNMFDKTFKPFVCRQECTGDGDPIDECMKKQFANVKMAFPQQNIECIQDFEMDHSRRPKVLVQTAGHVAGAVYYYQKSDIKDSPWKDEKKKICGVCIHPKYGGWFALRGIMIFKDILVPDLKQKSPPDVLPDDKSRIELLERFNFHWQDWSFRDIILPAERYSEQQKLYYITPPKDRLQLLDIIRSEVSSQ